MRRRKRERKNLLLVHFPFLVHRTKKNRKIENVVEKSILNGTSSSSPGPRRVIVFPHKSHVETYLLLLIWCFLLHNPPVRACLSLSLFLETEKRVVAISTTAKREEGSLRRFLLLAFSLKRPNRVPEKLADFLSLLPFGEEREFWRRTAKVLRRRRRRSDLVFHVKRRWSNNSERKQETSNHLKQFKTKCWSTAVKEDPSFLSWFFPLCVLFLVI